MTSRERLLAKAAEYRAEANKSIAAAHILGDWSQYERAIEEAKTYEWLAGLHHKTRAAWIRQNWGSK